MKKWIVVSSIILAASLGAIYFSRALPAFGKSHATELPTTQVKRETLVESTVATGTVKPMVGAEVKVGSQISGIVARLNVSVGDHVKKGDLLAKIDDSDLQAQVNTLQATIKSALAQEAYAEDELSRYQRIPEYTPQIVIDKSRSDLAVQRATVEQARAQLAEGRIRLGYTRITAPISGTIASVSTYQGETVAASLAAPTFTTIIDLSRLEIHAFVDETDIGNAVVGQLVKFRIDSFPDRELNGKVRAIYPQAQLVNNVVNYIVIIDIVDAQDLLVRPEMTAHVTFILQRRANTLSLPRSAVFSRSGRQYVVLRTPEGWTEKSVMTGMRTTQSVEIISGLRERDSVLMDTQRWSAQGESRD